jgi:hypothetical protein
MQSKIFCVLCGFKKEDAVTLGRAMFFFIQGVNGITHVCQTCIVQGYNLLTQMKEAQCSNGVNSQPKDMNQSSQVKPE